jgi:hypothetical protein
MGGRDHALQIGRHGCRAPAHETRQTKKHYLVVLPPVCCSSFVVMCHEVCSITRPVATIRYTPAAISERHAVGPSLPHRPVATRPSPPSPSGSASQRAEQLPRKEGWRESTVPSLPPQGSPVATTAAATTTTTAAAAAAAATPTHLTNIIVVVSTVFVATITISKSGGWSRLLLLQLGVLRNGLGLRVVGGWLLSRRA